MAQRRPILCEFFSPDGLCRTCTHEEEARATREEMCTRLRTKNLCCYLCSYQKSCEVSCNYLIEPEDELQFDKHFDLKIEGCRKKIERLHALFSESKISESSYTQSLRILEEKLKDLNEVKRERPLISPQYFASSERTHTPMKSAEARLRARARHAEIAKLNHTNGNTSSPNPIGIIIFGAILGYVGGLFTWWLFGQIQILLHVGFPYAAIYPPPLYYQIAWTVFCPVVLFFELRKK